MGQLCGKAKAAGGEPAAGTLNAGDDMKEQIRLIGVRTAVTLITLLAVGGCMTQANPNPYAPGVHESIPVPPGARLIAYGHYPLSFVAPREAGALYVWDMDNRAVSYMTHYTDGGMSAGDLNQLSKNSFDPNHSYRVYYVPAAATTATQPVTNQ